jgi:hypothetical protein
MKTKTLSIAILALFAFACGSKSEHEENQENRVSEVKYECPMGCTDQVFNQPGKCPECEMDLVKK